ncbi:glutaminase A [Nocardia sp. NPDC058058]|uniref:glutaminase A n=1 Tax=Nocardia sp. NPDC058058 TaxID=3346317 RepID=UPI0036DC4A20
MDDPVTAALNRVIDRHSGNTGGAVADYIPELARADPEAFAVATTSIHGDTYQAGAYEDEFTIQSVSKPFVFALAVAERGLENVAAHVGFEPSGEPFNAISLEEGTGRPANPLINAGAIVTTSLVPGDPAESFERIHTTLSGFAGRTLAVDEDVFASESATGDRNRALAYLTLSQGTLGRSAQESTDIYFRQCALQVTVTDLAVMAATLANGGVNPVTKRRIVSADIARITLSLMTTCGMYDRSGEWMVRVGLPAKSGVGGGIAAVSPGEFGIGVFSPRLDQQGNSVRGLAALTEMSERLGLHVFAGAADQRSPIAASDIDTGILSVRLKGEVDFVTAERITRHLQEMAATYPLHEIVLDTENVTAIRPVGAELVAATIADLRDRGIAVNALASSQRSDPFGA